MSPRKIDRNQHGDAPDAGASLEPGGARPARRGHRIRAAEFKAVCLKLMDRVERTGEEYVVTKRGRPVARLVPYEEERPRFVGRSRGVFTGTDEALLAPMDDELGAWESDELD